jgi:hypothetical protein
MHTSHASHPHHSRGWAAGSSLTCDIAFLVLSTANNRSVHIIVCLWGIVYLFLILSIFLHVPETVIRHKHISDHYDFLMRGPSTIVPTPSVPLLNCIVWEFVLSDRLTITIFPLR